MNKRIDIKAHILSLYVLSLSRKEESVMKMKLMVHRIHNMLVLSDLLARRQIRQQQEKRRKEVVIRTVREKDVPGWIRDKFR